MDSDTCIVFSLPPSPTQAEVEQFLDGDSCHVSTSKGQVFLSTEGLSSSYVTVTVDGSGEPGRVPGWNRTPPLKLSRLHRKLEIADCNMEHGTHFNGTWTGDLEFRESRAQW